jgi:hypothetical protein
MRHNLAFRQLLRSKGLVTHDDYPASGEVATAQGQVCSLHGIGSRSVPDWHRTGLVRSEGGVQSQANAMTAGPAVQGLP